MNKCMDRYIRAIEEAINEAQRIVDELYWEGVAEHKTQAAEAHLTKLRDDYNNGEIYDVLF